MSRFALPFALVGVLTVLAVAASAASATTGPYVALGDSYTAAPLVPNPTGNPILCGRSTRCRRSVRAARTTASRGGTDTNLTAVNGIVPTSAAYPLHPNQAGETNMATQVLGAL